MTLKFKSKTILWLLALALGIILGLLNIGWLNTLLDFVAAVYTRLFQFLAVPTIALAVVTTLASFGTQQHTGLLFFRTITFTLLTTICAAAVGLLLFEVIAPANLPQDVVATGSADLPQGLAQQTYFDHILAVVPNNIVTPFAQGNVLSILIVCVAFGLALAHLLKQGNDNVALILRALNGLQELLFTLIHALIWALPLGIVAFAAGFAAQVSAGAVAGSLGKYLAVILGSNCIQFFIVLPLFLLTQRINPIRLLRQMMPAVLMALFTKSSASTLPVTMRSAEENAHMQTRVTRFVLPICTIINMNGCAAFILVTSLFVLQNGGVELTWGSMLTWLVVAVFSAIGNAGVPMGCYFLTLSLMADAPGNPVGIMGVILPIFALIDMFETAENVWSDSCVCAMVNKLESISTQNK